MRGVLAVGTVALTFVATAIAASSPKSYVLRLQAMPTGFKVEKSYAVSLARAAKENKGSRKQLETWGYVTGY
jgi:hypothetical protein